MTRGGMILALLWTAVGAFGQPVWQGDWQATFDRARAEQRLVMAHVRSGDCLTCVEMERVTYAEPIVVSALEPFLLLRIDADAGATMGPYAIGTFRGIVVFDPTERPRFRYTGYQSPEELVRQAHLVRASTAVLVKAGQQLAAGDAVEGNMLLGTAYALAHDPEASRNAFAAAAAAAAARGDRKNEQFAHIRSALCWQEEDPERALSLLRSIEQSPIREVEFARQMGFVNVLLRSGRWKAARVAYQRALSNCPDELQAQCESGRKALRTGKPLPPVAPTWQNERPRR